MVKAADQALGPPSVPGSRTLRQVRSDSAEKCVKMDQENIPATGEEHSPRETSECLTPDLGHIFLQLLSCVSQLLPLTQQLTSNLLQPLIEFKILTTLLKPQLHITVCRLVRVWGGIRQKQMVNHKPTNEQQENLQPYLVQSAPGC